jgi:hypothetical protein
LISSDLTCCLLSAKYLRWLSTYISFNKLEKNQFEFRIRLFFMFDYDQRRINAWSINYYNTIQIKGFEKVLD